MPVHSTWLIEFYEGCSKSNASYFIVLAHSIRGIGSMAVETEPCQQYSITFCYCATSVSREAVWQNGIWLGSAYEAKVCHRISPCRKKMALIDTHQHLLNVHGVRTADVSIVRWWVCAPWGGEWCVSAVAIATVDHLHKSHGMQALVHHCWKCIANGGDYLEKQCFVAENLLYQTLLLCSFYLFLFPWKYIEGIIFGAPYIH